MTVTQNRRLIMLAFAAWCVLGVLLLTGCGGDKIRKQAAANANAGIDALALRQPDAVGKTIAAGAKRNVVTAAGEVDPAALPPAQSRPEDILASPADYARKADDLAEQYRQARRGAGLWGWLVGGAGLLLGALRVIPGAHQPVVGIVQGLLESAKDRTARQREQQLAAAAPVMMDVIEAFDAEGKIKRKVADKLPAGAADAVKAYLQEKARG